jgi:hypothetical protein
LNDPWNRTIIRRPIKIWDVIANTLAGNTP